MKYKLKKSCYIKLLITTILILIAISFNVFDLYSDNINRILAWAVIFFSVMLMIKFRNNMALFMMSFFIAYSNYSIAMSIYILNDGPDVLYSQISDMKIYGIGIFSILVFLIVLIMYSKKINMKKFEFETENNTFISIVLIFLLLFIIIFSYGRSNIQGVRGNSSPLYEYSTILFILLYYYGSKKKYIKILYSLLVIVYVLQSFLTGNRIEAIILLFSYFIFHFSEKITYKHTLPYLLFGIFLMIFIGKFRANTNVSLETVLKVINETLQSGFVFDTATWAYFPALCIIQMSSFINIGEKSYLLGQTIKYIFFGSVIQDNSLTIYARRYFTHYMGTVSPIYFYFWIKSFSPIIFSLLVSRYSSLFYNSQFKRNSSLKKLVGLYFVSTTPRWYLYGPFPLIRGILLFILCYILINSFSKLIERR